MTKISEKQIIDKYLSSETSEAEEQQLLQWLQKDCNQIIFKDHVKTKLLIDIKFKSFNSIEATAIFLKNIKGKTKTKNKKHFGHWMKYVSIFIGLVLVTTYTINWIRQNQSISKFSVVNISGISLKINGYDDVKVFEDKGRKVIKDKNGYEIGSIKNDILSYKNNLNNNNKVISSNILTVPYGKQFDVVLADGTSVNLNAGSVFKYPSNFDERSTREVLLEGEAYFKVAKDKNIPFIVKTEKLETRVYGTEFNVSAYLNDNSTEVVLVEGIVAVRESTKKGNFSRDNYIIRPFQKASKGKTLGNITIENVDINTHVAWKSGVLMFDNEDISSVFKKLERHFNVKIKNDYSELNKHAYTGVFRSENIEEILNTIRAHTNFYYVKKGNKIIITNDKQSL
jgi:hypothetical protein